VAALTSFSKIVSNSKPTDQQMPRPAQFTDQVDRQQPSNLVASSSATVDHFGLPNVAASSKQVDPNENARYNAEPFDDIFLFDRTKQKTPQLSEATPLKHGEEKPVLAKVPTSLDRFDSTKTNATAASMQEVIPGTSIKGQSKKIKMAFPADDE
jgi:hypothetical protein